MHPGIAAIGHLAQFGYYLAHYCLGGHLAFDVDGHRVLVRGRLSPGIEVRLRGAYLVRCTSYGGAIRITSGLTESSRDPPRRDC
jgi:hypothetical protein